MTSRPYYRRYASNALTGYMPLSLEERGAYTTILDMLYDCGEPIIDNERYLAGCMGCSVRKYRSVRDALIAKGKIYRTDDNRISNSRFEKERENDASFSRKQSENRTKRKDKTDETGQNNNKNNGDVEPKPNPRASSTSTYTDTEEEKILLFSKFWNEWEGAGGAGVSTQAETAWDDLNTDEQVKAAEHAAAFVSNWKSNASPDTHPIHGKTYLASKRWQSLPDRLKPAGVIIDVVKDVAAWDSWIDYFKSTGNAFSVSEMRKFKSLGRGTFTVPTKLPVYEEQARVVAK